MAPYPAPPPPPPPPETDSIIDGLGASNAETEQDGAVALPSFGGAEQNGLYDEAPGPQPEEKKPWDKPLTIPEIRKSSTNWSLASDAGLLLYLQEFSQRLIAKTSNLEKEVDGLVNTAKSANTKVHNTFNDFLMLANTQFIENRVYDDSEEVEAPDSEEKDSKKDPQSKSREQREAEVIPRVIKALTLGVNVLDTAFEQLDANAGNSDSEEEDATYKSVDPILEPKDLYAHRALPYIIGTPAFMQDDDVGLADLYSEDEEEEEGSSASSSEEEEESDLSESDYSVTASDSEEEEEAPRSKKGSQSASTAKSGASHEEQESDGDLFGSEQDESEDEDSEGHEKKKAKPKGSAFANELAAKIGAEPLGGGDDDEQATKERTVSEVSQGSEKVSKKESKRKKKSKKHRSETEVSKTEDDNLFSQPDPEEEDSPFGRKGLFSTTGGGLFDNNEDDGDGGLFDEAPADKTADHIYEAVSGADEPSSQKQRKKEKSREKPRSSSGLFEEDEDELFASTSSKKSEEPKKAKPVSKSDGGGLFADDDDDLFGAPQTKPAKKEEKMKAKSVDLFGEEDGDLFGDESQAQPSKVSEEKPKKKLPAGAVQMFGGANPLASKRQPSSSSSSSDDFEEPPEMASQPKPKPKPQEPTKAKPTDSGTKKKEKDDLFDDDEDDLFSTPREEKDKRPKNRAAESLFDDLEGEGTEDDLFAATAKPKESTKKKPPGGVALFGGADLFGEKETEGEGGKSPTKEEPPPLQKAPNRNKTNTLSLFNDQFDGEGGDDTLFAAPSKQKAEEEEEPNEDKATRRRTKSKSIFADEDVLFGTNEDDPSVDLFGSSSPTQPNKPESPTSPSRESSAPKTKERSSSSRGLFSDEEEDDLFGGGSSTAKSKDDGDNLFGEEKAPPSKPKEKPAVAAKEKKKKKVEVKEVTKKKTKTGGGGLFGEDDDGDDLFGEKSETTKEVEKEEAVEEDQSQAKEAEPVKRKKLAGAVSMFGGLDPTTIVKKRSSSSKSESEKEPSSPLSSPPSSKETPSAEPVSSKSPLHASPPLVTSPKPSKVPAKPAAKPAKAPLKTPPPLVSPSSPPPSSRISALQPRQFRKHAPFTRDYDPGIHSYHPDKPLPQIPQTSISRRNAGKYRSPSGSLSSSNRESTHSPPVPERVPQVQHPRSHSREQHLTPPKWRYVENGRRYHLEEDYGGKDVGSHCHPGGASYSKDPSSPLPMRHYDIYESYLVNSDSASYFESRSPCEREFLSDQDVLTDQARWTQRKRRNRSRERKPVPMKRNGLLTPDWEESGSGSSLLPKAPLTANNSSDIEVWDRPPPPLPKPRTLHSNNVSRHPNQSDHRQDGGNCVVRRKKSYKHAPLKLSYSGDSDSSTSSETSLAFHSADVASPYNQRKVLRCASPPKSLPLKSRCMENRCHSPYQLSPLSETQSLDSPDSPRKLKCQISSPFHPRHGVFDDSYFNDGAKAKRNSPTDPNHCLTPPPRPPKPPSLSPTSDDYRTIESSFGHASKESPLNPPQVKPRSFPNKSPQVGKEIPPHPKPPKPKNEGSDLSKFLTKKPHESIVSMCFERIPPEGSSIKKRMNGNHIPEDSNLEYRDLPILPEFLNPIDERQLKVSYSSTSSSGYASSDWSIGRSDLRQNSIASILSDHHGNGEQKHLTPKAQVGSVPSCAVRLRNPSMVVSEVGPSQDQQSRPAGSGRARKPCRETFLLKKSLFESLSGGLSGSSMLKPTGFDEPFPRIGLSPNRISSKQEHSLSPVGEYPSPPSSKKKKHPPQVAPKPRSRKLNGMDERSVPEQRNKEDHRHAGTTRNQGDSYKANLAINPSALKPGAAPPVKEDAPREVGFDVPVTTNTLTSLQKQRARPTGKRRLPSRRKTGSHSNPSLFGEVKDTADIGGAVGGLDIPDTSIDFHLPDPSPPPILSRSPPVWRSVAPPTSSGKARSQDLFGNNDLFGDDKDSHGFDSSPGARPKIKSETTTGSDIFSDSNKPPAEDPLSLGGSSEISSGNRDSENSNRKAKTKQPAEEPADGDGDLFAEVPPTTVKPRVSSIVMDDEDDLFGEKPKSKKEPLSPSLDVDDDLFASSSISPPPPEKSVPDDDLFGESSGAKPKKKTTAKAAAAVEDDNDDLFAAKPAPKKKAKGKKVKPDSDLFADTTDIFADLPASKPKTKKTKKNADLFKNTGGDDIFSSDSSGTPTKTKKKAKKKTDKKQVSDSIFDTSAPSIFDDPLNATKTE